MHKFKEICPLRVLTEAFTIMNMNPSHFAGNTLLVGKKLEGDHHNSHPLKEYVSI